ncbi:MAG TPA: SpoIIE family protein phosphatase [Anaeromyxobacteraceae bacterium]
MTVDQRRSIVEWGSAGAALEGEDESGDVHVVAAFPGGALVAVIDGLGHGTEAAAASKEAARVLERHASEPLSDLVERCHEALRYTRGAVMSIASFSRDGSMSWIAIGNVEAILLRAGPAADPRRETIALRGGVVGYQLPALRPSAITVSRGDTLVMATDGIRSGFIADLDVKGTPQEIADSILARFARGTDDALVVVARYAGAAP